MSGRVLVSLIVMLALIGGAAMYYLQVYAYYRTVVPVPGQDVRLVPVSGGAPEPIDYGAFQAIDATSSPIRYRACFTTSLTPAEASRLYQRSEHNEPRVAPGWFDCFDAEEIGQDLAQGRAAAFLGVKNIAYGVDRVVVITEDGRGFAWHELNQCGKKAYDGTVVGEECPPRDGTN